MVKKVIVIFCIIALLLLMIVPSYLNFRFADTENLIKSRLRALYEANELYKKTHRPPVYPDLLSELTKTNPPLIGPKMTAEKQLGYLFVYEKGDGDKFSIVSKPYFKYLTGYHTFYIDETGIIRLNDVSGDPIDA